MIYLLTAISVLLPTYLVRFDIGGIPSTLLEVLIYVVFVVGLIRALQEKDTWKLLQSRLAWLVPAGLIALGGLLGVLIAPDLRAALGLYKGFILDPMLVYVLALAFLQTRNDMRVLGWGLFGGATFVALWSLVDVGNLQTAERVIGPYALDANASPNYLAFALAPLLPLAVWVGSRRGHLRGEWLVSSEVKEAVPDRHSLDHRGFAMTTWGWVALTSLAAIVIILGLQASDSRAGLVAGLGGLSIAIVLSFQLSAFSFQVRRALVVFLLAACALSWFAVRPNFDLSPEQGGRITASNNVRWQLWSATGELVQQHWLLGTGLGGFQEQFGELTKDRVNYPEFITPRARTPHNLIVGVWMEMGLIGLIGLIVAIVLVGKTLFRALRRPQDRTAAAALLGSWFVLLAHGLVDQPIWKNDTMVMFWLLVALSAVIAEDKK